MPQGEKQGLIKTKLCRNEGFVHLMNYTAFEFNALLKSTIHDWKRWRHGF